MSINVSVVGLGRMGRQHAVALRDFEGSNIIAGVDAKQSVRDEFQSETRLPMYSSIPEAIDDLPLDAITIAIPHASTLSLQKLL